MKVCKRCEDSKSECEFYPHPHAADRLSTYCKLCSNEVNAIWRTENKEHIKAYQRARDYVRRFNITEQQYDGMVVQQGGLCVICEQPEKMKRAGKIVALAVDHDHLCCPAKGTSCGACIRELLCVQCNNGLGRFNDDPALLRKAADYIERHRAIRAA